jgi:hypothetical protein
MSPEPPVLDGENGLDQERGSLLQAEIVEHRARRSLEPGDALGLQAAISSLE